MAQVGSWSEPFLVQKQVPSDVRGSIVLEDAADEEFTETMAWQMLICRAQRRPSICYATNRNAMVPTTCRSGPSLIPAPSTACIPTQVPCSPHTQSKTTIDFLSSRSSFLASAVPEVHGASEANRQVRPGKGYSSAPPKWACARMYLVQPTDKSSSSN